MIPLRLKAFAIHLLASLVVISLLCYVVIAVWYPVPYGELMGSSGLLSITLGAFLVSGPLLTLLVFTPHKARHLLLLDISVILLLQSVALGWGVRNLYLGRPLYLAYENGLFYTVTAQDIAVERIQTEGLRPALFKGPQLVYVRPIADAAERSRQLMGLLAGELPDLPFQPDRYQPFVEHLADIVSRGREQGALDANAQQTIRRLPALDGRDGQLFYTVFNGTTEGTLVVDRASGEPLAYLPLII